MTRVEIIKKAFDYLVFKGVITTRADFADAISYNRTNLSSAMNGNEKYLSDSLMNKISQAFPEFDKNWLLTGEGAMLKVSAATMTPYPIEGAAPQGGRYIVRNHKKATPAHIGNTATVGTAAPIAIIGGSGALLDPSAPAGVTGTLPMAQPSATPTEAMRDGVNVITDAESVDLSELPVKVVEEIKAEVAKEIEKEIIVPIVPHEIATKTETNIRMYVEDNASELAHFDPRTITAEVDIAETITTTSMSPIYMPNDKVFIKFLKEKTKITDGKIYYFDTKTRPTMVRMVKLLDDGRLLLRAANPRYGDIYLCKEEIINIGEIKSIYRDTFGDQYLEIEDLRRKKDAQTDELIKQNGDALKIVDRLVSVIEKKQ